MASISPPSFPPASAGLNNPHKLYSSSFGFASSQLNRRSSKSGISIARASDFKFCCRCHNRGENSDSARGWDFELGEMLRNTFGWFDDYMRSLRVRVLNGGVAVEQGEDEEEEWDWERWRKHFSEVDEQERLVLLLKTQLGRAIEEENYQAAASIKVAIAAASTNDTVTRVMSHMKKSVEEECYGDAAFWRDYAAGGLVGWWAGTSEDADDPYGRIIHISAEYGRYIARSYSPRQLATASVGAPVFEVYITSNQRGEYKQQAVYLKRKGAPRDPYVPTLKSSETTRDLDSRDTRNNKSKLFERSSEDIEDTEDMDDDSGFDSVLRDMIPGVKVKVVKVTAPEKVDRDIISKVIEQIIDEEEKEEEEEEEEENDYDIENIDVEDETKSESENENENDEVLNDTGKDAGGVMTEDDEQNKIAVEVIINDGFIQKMSRGTPRLKDLLRVPARLEKKGRLSFTFTVEEDANGHISSGDGQSRQNKKAQLLGKRSVDHVMLDLVKSIGKGKIPMKVLQDVGELINVTLNQARNLQPLSGSTTFDRIDISSSSDPLDGLYIGTHGLHTSEVIHMKRRFGQWEEGGSTKKSSKLEFYEYVEAVKLTGDPYVPAGQVSFRAKIGKRYQLPHKGILPEEFGVIARYKGQGRLAEAGFQNPRWVDGELVILDGKSIKGGPVVGFVYWAPEYHFLVFFNRLNLQQD